MTPDWNVLLLLTAFCLLTCFPKDTLQGIHEDRLIKDIFKDYNPYSRPVQNEEESVEIMFGLDLQQIIGLDEKTERLITNIWLKYDWYDPKMRWNASHYGGIGSIRMPYRYVWTPDILLYNSVDEDIDSKFPTNVVIYNNGWLNWIPIGIYSSACTVKIKWFPFDDQLCPLKFGSWTYDSTKINMTMQKDAIVLDTYAESGEWELIGTPHQRRVFCYDCCPEPYVDVTFYLYIRRRPLYYGFNLIIPCALISLLALLTFCLPPDAGEKISLGITVIMGLSVFQMILADMIPKTSIEVPILGIYFCGVQIVCTMSVIMTVLVLNFHHRNPDMYEMPEWVRKVICEWLAWILRVKRPGRDISREYIKRKRKQRDLVQKQPQSRSLISNIRDVDNSIPVNDYLPFKTQNRSFDDPGGFKTELLQILNELRFITCRMKENDLTAEEVNDWKFAALVIDRLCLILFTGYTFLITAGLFSAALFSPKDTAEAYPEKSNLILSEYNSTSYWCKPK